MNKYKFKLEALLKYRTLLKDEAQKVFAAAKKKLEDDMQLLNKIRNKIYEATQALKLLQEGYDDTHGHRGALSVDHLVYYTNYIGILRDDEQNQLKLISQSKERVNETRDAFIKTDQDLKIVEKLKEKDFERYLSELSKEELNLLDEMGGNLFFSNRKK